MGEVTRDTAPLDDEERIRNESQAVSNVEAFDQMDVDDPELDEAQENYFDNTPPEKSDAELLDLYRTLHYSLFLYTIINGLQ